jgi:aminopeptidase N
MRVANELNRSLTIKLKQNWFRLDLTDQTNSSEKWYIPFTFTLKSKTDFSFESVVYWMQPEQSELTLNIPYLDEVNSNWIIGNIQHSGYYRVNYDLNNWNLLIQQLRDNHSQIDVVNRATLIDDAFNLAKAEYLNQTLYLELISYLINENESLPFQVVTDSLSFLNTMLSQDYMAFSRLKEFCKRLYQKSYDRLAWNSSLTDMTQT